MAAITPSPEDVCVTPVVPANAAFNNYYTIRLELRRAAARKYLTEQGMANQIYYPMAAQEASAPGGKRGDLAKSRNHETRSSLPMFRLRLSR